ncbi:MAG: hypothetical protein CMM48_02850 [Rhodospirillaceae bacterium]|nr:hypothetical protein [Rhodospirillaceae bacterium]HAA91626.1 hypothetical protein [Rhodospirillaceae bacterium]
MADRDINIGLNAVIMAVTEDAPRVLTVHREVLAEQAPVEDSPTALPFGPFEPDRHRTLELGLREWVEEQTGLALGYVEQLYTFGDRNRDPRERAGGSRVVSIGYLALVREDAPHGAEDAEWVNCYDFLPWEDWRDGRPALLDEVIVPALDKWANAVPEECQQRTDRVSITFATDDAPWDVERVLDRYELLYEAGLVREATRDSDFTGDEDGTGRSFALDHRRILATALGRLRGKIKYRPVVFELLAPTFTLLNLQNVVEALSGVGLHKQNFRRLVTNNRLVEATGNIESAGRGRPAALFQFRRDVLRERPQPGVGLPARQLG